MLTKDYERKLESIDEDLSDLMRKSKEIGRNSSKIQELQSTLENFEGKIKDLQICN